VRSGETDAAPTLAKGLARIARGDTRFIAYPRSSFRCCSRPSVASHGVGGLALAAGPPIAGAEPLGWLTGDLPTIVG
jgi:hypothetical protein